jgi:hypothetical protein
VINDSIFSRFEDFVKKSNFSYKDSFEINLEKAVEYAKRQKLNNGYIAEVEAMLNKVRTQRIDYFKLYQEQIADELAREIISRYKYEDELIAWGLKNDNQVKTAVAILKNEKSYNLLLGLK